MRDFFFHTSICYSAFSTFFPMGKKSGYKKEIIRARHLSVKKEKIGLHSLFGKRRLLVRETPINIKKMKELSRKGGLD